jgi:hypothetical protein
MKPIAMPWRRLSTSIAATTIATAHDIANNERAASVSRRALCVDAAARLRDGFDADDFLEAVAEQILSACREASAQLIGCLRIAQHGNHVFAVIQRWNAAHGRDIDGFGDDGRQRGRQRLLHFQHAQIGRLEGSAQRMTE